MIRQFTQTWLCGLPSCSLFLRHVSAVYTNSTLPGPPLQATSTEADTELLEQELFDQDSFAWNIELLNQLEFAVPCIIHKMIYSELHVPHVKPRRLGDTFEVTIKQRNMHHTFRKVPDSSFQVFILPTYPRQISVYSESIFPVAGVMMFTATIIVVSRRWFWLLLSVPGGYMYTIHKPYISCV